MSKQISKMPLLYEQIMLVHGRKWILYFEKS